MHSVYIIIVCHSRVAAACESVCVYGTMYVIYICYVAPRKKNPFFSFCHPHTNVVCVFLSNERRGGSTRGFGSSSRSVYVSCGHILGTAIVDQPGYQQCHHWPSNTHHPFEAVHSSCCIMGLICFLHNQGAGISITREIISL